MTTKSQSPARALKSIEDSLVVWEGFSEEDRWRC